MGKLNIFTLARSSDINTPDLADRLRQTSPPTPVREGQKLFGNINANQEYVTCTVKWFDYEKARGRSDPDFELEDQGTSKKYAVTVWFTLGSRLVLVFTDVRSVYREVREALFDALGCNLEIVELSHQKLASVLNWAQVTNVYGAEFRDPRLSSGINSYSLQGQSINTSPVFGDLVKTSELSKLNFEFSIENDSFLATLYASGRVILSPYVAETHVKLFAQALAAGAFLEE